MTIPEAYLPKFKGNALTIPVLPCASQEAFNAHLAREVPFIFEADLHALREKAERAIHAIDQDVEIRTYDSIPYREIRKGGFHAYLAYAASTETECLYPEGFELVESREGNVSETHFRHYALSLNETLFPAISQFRVPFIDERNNYLLQLPAPFFSQRSITSPHWLFIHPALSVSNAHYDHDSVHTAIVQLKGRKWACLIPPNQHHLINNVDFPLLPNGFNDFTNPKLQALPCEGLTPWEGDLNEGQILIIPKNWVHFVVGKSSGISYSQDIVNATNFKEWMTSIIAPLV